MLFHVIVSILAIFFAYLNGKFNSNINLKISFGIIFIFLALRFEYGNDYNNYSEIFSLIINTPLEDLVDLFNNYEPGWIFLNYVLKNYEFHVLIIITSLLTCITFYYMVNTYVDKKIQWFSLFFITFNPSIILVGLTTMRQNIAILIFIISLKYILNNNIVKYIITIISAALFHYTSLVLLPIYYLCNNNNKKLNINVILLLSVIPLIIYFMLPLLNYGFVNILSYLPEKYSFHSGAAQTNSGLGFLYMMGLLFIILINYNKQDNNTRAFSKILYIKYLLIPLNYILALLGRFGLYFDPLSSIVFPNIVLSINNKLIKFIIYNFLVLGFLYQYANFMYSDEYSNYFLIYNSILNR